ncbi:MAG: leucine-rich repeat domain-containing protein [Solobacterium sp.]|nr:leucine-rich repeat domain-containing protein [Solobacterium sp.]
MKRYDEKEFVIDENGVLTEYNGHDTEIVLPAGTKSIGEAVFMCFRGYRGVKKLIVPEGVTEIQSSAFLGSCLEEIALPSTLNKIESNAFCYCGSLRSITIPDGITEIAESAFAYSGLEEIHLPKHLAKIGRYAFYKCSSLRYIDLSNADSIEIGDGAFAGCIGLTDENGMLIIQNRLFAVTRHPQYIIEDFDVPDHVSVIEDGVFTDGQYHITMSLNCPLWHTGKNPNGTVLSLLKKDGSSISFRDADGKIVAKVVVLTEPEDSSTAEKMLLSIRLRKSGRFDFAAYDRMFSKLEIMNNRLEMALTRLRYPYGLTEKAEEKYISYLREQGAEIGRLMIERNDKETMRFLMKKKAFCAADIPGLVEYAQEQKEYDYVTALLDYQSEELGKNDVYQSLSLSDDTEEE